MTEVGVGKAPQSSVEMKWFGPQAVPDSGISLARYEPGVHGVLDKTVRLHLVGQDGRDERMISCLHSKIVIRQTCNARSPVPRIEFQSVVPSGAR